MAHCGNLRARPCETGSRAGVCIFNKPAKSAHILIGSKEVGHCGRLVSIGHSQNRSFQPSSKTPEKRQVFGQIHAEHEAAPSAAQPPAQLSHVDLKGIDQKPIGISSHPNCCLARASTCRSEKEPCEYIPARSGLLRLRGALQATLFRFPRPNRLANPSRSPHLYLPWT